MYLTGITDMQFRNHKATNTAKLST